jgi:hypothetical protein
VLQLAADAAPSTGAIRGRAVHIVSGEAASFESMSELLGFLDAAIARAEQGERGDRGRQATTPTEPSEGEQS